MGLADPPLALLLLVFCVFVIVIYRLSVVISDLKDANIAMAQRLAIVEFQLQNRNEDIARPKSRNTRAAVAVAAEPRDQSLDVDLRRQPGGRACSPRLKFIGRPSMAHFCWTIRTSRTCCPTRPICLSALGYCRLRPLFMFTFWLNFQQSGAQDTFGYHAVNVLLHFFNAIFIFLAVRKVLSWAGVEESRARILSFFAAGLFLLHPVQTESVSYIASRSETLSVFFVLAALVGFLYRKGAVRVDPANPGAARRSLPRPALSKEHTAVLPALFILTDYYWNFEFSPSVIWRNWKLYVPIAAGAAFALAVISGAFSAGTKPRASRWRVSRGINTSSPSAG